MQSRFSIETLRHYLSRNPWLRLVLPFGAGIATGLHIPSDCRFFYLEMYGLLPFLLLAYWLTSYRRYGMGLQAWIPGSIGLLFLFCAGLQLARARTSLHAPAHFSRQAWEALYIRVQSVPEDRGRFLRFEARVLFGKGPSETVPQDGPTRRLQRAEGRLLVYLRHPGEAEAATPHRPGYGDELWIRADFQELPPPQNPGAFDFRSYLASSDIYHQVFLTASQWTFTGHSAGNPLVKWADRLQKELVATYDSLFENRENAALLSAFVLGHRTGIDRDTMNAFAATGTIHILSVSGLHVAILYWLVKLLLRPFRSVRGGRFLCLALTLCSISFYALITGLAPPVCRAACVINLYAVGEFLNRQRQGENTLALTAFLLLTADPLSLADVGFQLSFLAVGGLVFFYPALARLYPGNRGRSITLGERILGQGWAMTAVSLTAQLTTFPLAMYYFHQFPVYFLPANLLLTPLASLILYGGILLLLIPGTGAVATFLAGLISFLMDLMKAGMHFFSGLPGALIEGIWITPLECAAFYVVIIGAACFLRYRHGAALILTLCFSVLLAASFALESLRQSRQRLLVWFHLKNTEAIGLLAGRSAILLMDTPPPPADYAYSLKPMLDRSGIRTARRLTPSRDTATAFLVKKEAYLQFSGLRILLVGKEFSYPVPQGKVLPCDVLLVTENTYLQMAELSKTFRINMLVTGNTISQALERYLEAYCRKNGIAFHSIGKSGAFVRELPHN